jgi:ADP-ribose pyrophosphatase YjhB (NUDIX family)
MEKIIIASGPVIVKDNKVLLDQHGDTDFWKFCGGRVNKNESLLTAAKKRAKEELGIDIEFLDENPYMTFTEKETSDGSMDVILAHFLARAEGEIKPREDIRKWKWIPLEELGKEPLAPNIIPVLQHFGFLK